MSFVGWFPGEPISHHYFEPAFSIAGHAELLDTSQHGPREPADGLAPAERLLDALSLLRKRKIFNKVHAILKAEVY
jgi:hypothetical protein